MRRGIIPNHSQWSRVLRPQLPQESGGGCRVAVALQFHPFHLAGFQAHRRIIAGLFAPARAGRVHQGWLSFEHPFAPQSLPRTPIRGQHPLGSGPRRRRKPWLPPAAPRPPGRHTPPRRSPLAASALSRRFLGRFSTNPNRCRACPRVDGGNSGNCCGSGRPRNVPAQICAPPSSSNWPSRGQPLLETPAPLPSVRSAALRRSRGGTTRLLKGHRPRTALAEDGNPPANIVDVGHQGHWH